MSDDQPFPPDEAIPYPNEIGLCTYTFTFPAVGAGSPRASYRIEVLDQFRRPIGEIKEGQLFGGDVDHLRAEDKAALVSMQAHLKAKAAAAWIGSQ